MVNIFPSLISADLLRLEKEIKQLEPYCAGFHLDVMDFHFVPNLTWGPAFINDIKSMTCKPLHVHLMVEFPEKYIDRLLLKPEDVIFVHIESPTKLPVAQLFEKIRKKNVKIGVAIKPTTPLEALITLPAHFDYVLIMTVQPGFSGQAFLPYMLDKIKAVAHLRVAHNFSFIIAVDGGINQETIKKVVKAGAQDIAIASAIFDCPDRIQAVKKLEEALLSC